jgi:hypothetical protein
MPDEHALAAIVGRWLGKFTGARDVAAADVEPVTSEPPFWNSVHAWLQSILHLSKQGFVLQRGKTAHGSSDHVLR